MKKVVIFGAGGQGREALEIFKDQNVGDYRWEILGFIDETPALQGKIINDFPILGGIEWLEKNADGISCIVAIGDPRGKKRVVKRLESIGVNFVNAIHPSVTMSEFVDMGVGIIMCAGAILTVNISIGNHVLINMNSTIGHDTVINDYCSIMPNVSVSGNDTLGEGVYVGTGAALIEKISIGDWTTIGAGAAVINDISEYVVAVGVPAKIVKSVVEV